MANKFEQTTQLTSHSTKCALCQQDSPQQFLLSAPSGQPDLDNRPTGLARNATINAIQQCPTCGYCAREIDIAPDAAASVVAGDAYQASVTVPTLFDKHHRWHHKSNVLAAQWHGLSLIQEAGGANAAAGWSAMSSAWVYDDAKLAQLARAARVRAIDLFRMAQAQGERFSDDEHSEAGILADLSRRTDEFGAALAFCDQAEREESSIVVRKAAAFQRELARRRDSRCHNISEATSNRNGNRHRGTCPRIG
jgi:hypothetical protein